MNLKNIDPDKAYPEVTEILWKYVYYRDGGLCQVCGRAGEHAHHVRYRSQHSNGNYANNLILFCQRCHAEEHDKNKHDVEYLLDRIVKNTKKFKESMV